MRLFLFSALFLFFVGYLTTGCSKTVYMPVESESVSSDTIRIYKWKTDSIFIKDSIDSKTSGDTIFITRWRDRSRIMTLRDTVFIEHSDTVKVAMTVPTASYSNSKKSNNIPIGTVIIIVAACVAILAICITVIRLRRS